MPVGSTVVVPIVNPRSAGPLMRLAAMLAVADEGVVVPVTVVPPSASRSDAEAAHRLVREAEEEVAGTGVKALGVVTVAPTAAEGVLEAVDDRGASLVVMGWAGISSTRNVFGELIDSIVGRSSVPLAVVRLGETTPIRVVFPVSTEQLVPAGLRGMHLATGLVTRLQAGYGGPVLVLRTGQGEAALPDEVVALGDRVHHDARRIDIAVGAVARPGDLIVTPVAPTVSGLRAATTHIAWAAPDASLVVAVDVGPPPSGNLATAVRRAHLPPPSKESAGRDTVHVLHITVWPRPDGPAGLDVVGEPLAHVGTVVSLSTDDTGGRVLLRATVEVPAPDANAALAKVMDRLQSAPALRGTEIHYDVGL